MNTHACRKPGSSIKCCPCGDAFYHQWVHNHIDLTGHWMGWRFRGRDLVSPDRQRINVTRLEGILLTEHLRAWRLKSHPAQGIVIPFQPSHLHQPKEDVKCKSSLTNGQMPPWTK